MKKLIQNTSLAALLASTIAFGTAGIAHADECEDAIAAVTQAMEEAELGDDDKAAIEQAVATASEQQGNGDVEACTATLSEPMEMLGVN